MSTKKNHPHKPLWRKVLRIVFKTLGWIVGIVIFLLLALWFGLKIPAVQQFAKDKAVNFLEGKIGTEVRIARIDLVLPKMIALKGVYFEDQSKDTLLYGEKLQVDIALLKLLDNRLEINRIDLAGINAKIRRNEQSVFNFDYIVKAFASQDTTATDTSKAAMVIALDKINLDRIRILYDDKVTGMVANANLGHFDTRIKTFDLENSRFVVPRINLQSLSGSVVQNKPLAQQVKQSIDEPETAAPLPDVDIDEVLVGDINFSYDNFVSSTFASLNLGRLEAILEKIDLRNEQVQLEKLLFHNNKIVFRLGKKEEAKKTAKTLEDAVDTVATKLEKKGWVIQAAKVDFANNNVFFDNDNVPRQRRGMDYVHLGIRNLTLNADDFIYSADSIGAQLNQLAFRDTSGTQINSFKTNFAYTATQAYLRNLELITPHSSIRRNIEIRYPSIAAIGKNLNLLQLNTDLSNSRIGIQDILNFVPALYSQPMFAANRNRAIIIEKGRLNGTIGRLQIPALAIRAFSGTAIDVSGSINGLPEAKNTVANLQIRNLQTNAVDLNTLLPKGTLPASIRIPERMALNGTLNGGMNNLLTRLNLNTSMGNGRIEANLANATLKGREKAGLKLSLNNFQLGRLLKQEQQLGNITLRAQGSVYNFDPKQMTASMEAVVASAQVKGYNYTNLNANVVAKQGNYDVQARMADKNVSFTLDALANMNSPAPAIKASLDLDSINLQALNFTKDFLGLHGKLEADIPVADINRLQGTVNISNLLIVQPERRIVMDTIQIAAALADSNSSIRLRSDIATASLTGNYTLTDLPNAALQIINRYYAISSTPPPALKRPQQASFAFTISNTKTLQSLVPNLQFYENISATGELNSATNTLNLNANIPSIQMGENRIAPATLALNSRDSGLVYDINLQGINNPGITLYKTRLNGILANNQLRFALNTKDKTDADKYALGGQMQMAAGENILSLNPQVLLNKVAWQMNPQNRIEFGAKGLLAQGFVLSNNGQSLSINSRSTAYNSPILVQFQNFQIETLTQIVEKDTLLLGGAINGQAELINLQQSAQFTTDLTISNFNYKGDTLGNIAAKVDNLQANRFAANVAITGFGNNVLANGFYYTNNPANAFDLNLNVERLNLQSIQGFASGFANQMSGYINGQLKLTGTATNPAIRGNLAFKQAALNVKTLNSYYRLNNETISFKEDGIHFDDFTILDSANQQAVIDGAVYTTTFRDYRFGMNITANNFRVLNSTRKDNQLYYGKLFIDSKIKVSGDLNLPVVDVTLKVNDKSDVTVVLPQSDPQAQSRDGVVAFFDPENPEYTELFSQAQKDSLNKSAITGLDVTANITIEKEAQLSLVIDEANGDFVRLKGEGQLSGGIDPSGKTSLTGVYEMKQGAYEMTFQVIKRRFDIKPGSRLVWNGEPTDATVDITAVYKANTPPIDLVEDQLTENNKNFYKQRLPFDVNLNMRGQLLQPEISFDIVLQENNLNVNSEVTNTVKTKLDQIRQQPTELNKQVFAVLLLNRFIAENPFASAAGGSGAEGILRQSVSKLLSEQLNSLAGGLIQGVDLNFDLESTSDDYTTGERANRTDLNVGVSKRLLNDRLKVSVGSNFGIEGPQQANQKASNIAGDIQVDYQLSKDGRYLLRAYRKDQYQVALQGQVVETGLGFILNIDYNKFREIFMRKPKNPDAVEDKRRRKANNNTAPQDTTSTAQ